MEGNGIVRRFFSAFAKDDEAKDTPVIRRIAPRNVSVIFMMISLGKTRAPRIAGLIIHCCLLCGYQSRTLE
jgi:hypothetical protein